jgi:hypothetical protein
MLKIQSVKTLHNGRSMVETRGTYPFQIMEHGTMGGYMVARIERCSFRPFSTVALRFLIILSLVKPKKKSV